MHLREIQSAMPVHLSWQQAHNHPPPMPHIYLTYCQCWGGWWQILWIWRFQKHLSHDSTFRYIQLLCLLFLQEFCLISPDAVCLFVWIPENEFGDNIHALPDGTCSKGAFLKMTNVIQDNPNSLLFCLPSWRFCFVWAQVTPWSFYFVWSSRPQTLKWAR